MQVRPWPNVFPSLSLSSLLTNGVIELDRVSLRSCVVQNQWFLFNYGVCQTKAEVGNEMGGGDSGHSVKGLALSIKNLNNKTN